MARLNQIEIRESEATYTNQRDWCFHHTGHHVRELLLDFIGRAFVLDGSSKFCAIFGQRPDNEKPFETVLGVTSFYIEDFDVEHHMTRPVEEQQEAILTSLSSVMIQAAIAAGGEPNIIRSAADEVRRNGFACAIPISKLAKSTKDRKLRVHVFRCLGPRVGEIWEARVSTRDGTVLGVEPITECPDYLDRTDQFSKSSWSDNIFQITSSRFKTVEYSLDISPYMGDLSEEAAQRLSRKHAKLQHQRALAFAVSEANKAFSAKNYELVIHLLSPFADELDRLMQARLAYARKKH